MTDRDLHAADENAAELAERNRQTERTADSLKRLYAVLFALSFGIAAAAVYDHFQAALNQSPFDWRAFLLHTEMSLAFVMSAGLFYFQADRFLDVVNARKPAKDMSPQRFGVEFLVSVVTMTPFYVMAHALNGKVTSATGYTWYVFGYLLLMVLTLVNLIVRDALSALEPREYSDHPSTALRVFWMLLNSLMLLLAMGLFDVMGGLRSGCPTNDPSRPLFGFVLAFGLLTLLRDYLDFSRGWPVLHPVRPGSELAQARWPLALFRSAANRRIGRVAVLVMLAAFVALAAHARAWNLSSIAVLCAAH